MIQLLLIISKTGTNKVSNLKFLLKNFGFYTEIDRLMEFLNCTECLYGLIFNSLLIKHNKQLEEKLNNYEKGDKSISDIYYENYLVACRIEELEKQLDGLRADSRFPMFVEFVFSFYEKFIRKKELLKWYANKGIAAVPADEGRCPEAHKDPIDFGQYLSVGGF